MQLYAVNFIPLLSSLYMFRAAHTPIIRSTTVSTATGTISIEGFLPVPVAARSKASTARLLRLWVRIPPGAWMSVCCECCVLSGRGLCFGLITRPGESYRLWCVVCDLETSSRMRRPWTALGCSVMGGEVFYSAIIF